MQERSAQIPELADLGALEELSVEAEQQTLTLRIAYARLSGLDGTVTITAAFAGVCYLKMNSDIPASFFDNDVDLFEERAKSTLLSGLRVWQGGRGLLFESDLGTRALQGPTDDYLTVRHFAIKTTFQTAEWLCTDALFTIQSEADT